MTKRNLWLSILSAATALTPIYTFSSGGIQPAHMLFAVLMLLVFLDRAVIYTSVIKIFTIFAVYAMAIEVIYGVFNSSIDDLIHPIFLFYNIFLIAAVYSVVIRCGIGAVKIGLFFAVAIALSSIFLIGVSLTELGDEGRPIGTFNNPNQLGYFSVCALTLTYLLYHLKHLKYWNALILYFSSLLLSILSLSKAAIISNFLVVLFVMIPVGHKKSIIFLLAIIPFVLYFVYSFLENGLFDGFLFVDRLAGMMDESDSSFAERGYFAFLNGNPMQIVFGMGNANIEKIVTHEVHSTLGSVINSYGIVGLILFMGVLYIWWRVLFSAFGLIPSILLFTPAMMYGISHNGIRFTIFWLLVASSYALAQKKIKINAARQQ